MTGRPGRSGMRRSAAALVLAALGPLAGCADPGGEGLGGPGLPVVEPGDVAGERARLTGTMHVEDNGCFTWTGHDDAGGERRWVVWPPGADHDGDRVRLADGSTVTDGDAVTGAGLRADAGALPDWEVTDSYFRAFGTFCGADERGIVVLDDVHLAER